MLHALLIRAKLTLEFVPFLNFFGQRWRNSLLMLKDICICSPEGAVRQLQNLAQDQTAVDLSFSGCCYSKELQLEARCGILSDSGTHFKSKCSYAEGQVRMTRFKVEKGRNKKEVI